MPVILLVRHSLGDGGSRAKDDEEKSFQEEAKILARLLSRPGRRRGGSACSWAVRRPNWKMPRTELNIGSLSSSFTQAGDSPRRALRPKTRVAASSMPGSLAVPPVR